MRVNKACILVVILIWSSIVLTGCWNYREIEQLAIVSGVALDINEDNTIHLTVEVVDVGTDGQVSYEPVYIEEDGDTFFEAARRGITLEGKRLYWSHAKVVIVSEDIAKQDVTKYLDFLYRDAEAREDIWLLVSREKTAGEILKSKGKLKPIVSFQIDDAMRSQKSISRFPNIELYEFFDRLFYKNVAPILPMVRLVNQQGEPVPQVEGTAIFKDKKLIGTFDDEDTECMLWLRDEVKGGLVILKDIAGTGDDVALEIHRSNSQITPTLQGGVLKMKVHIDLEVCIGEIEGSTDFISNPGRQKLIKAAKKQIESIINATYIKARDKYKADVFGFGRRIEMKLPYVWYQIENDWDEAFGEVELEVNVDIKLMGSAATRTPLKAGE